MMYLVKSLFFYIKARFVTFYYVDFGSFSLGTIFLGKTGVCSGKNIWLNKTICNILPIN